MKILRASARFFAFVVALFLAPTLASAQARWIARNPAPTSATIKALAGGNGLYVAVSGSGLILTSTDGATWEVQTLFTKENLNNVSFAEGSFFARGDSGTVFVSRDGHTWFQRVNGNVASGFGPPGHAAAYGAGAWVLIGGFPYSFSVLVSTDATTFAPLTGLFAANVSFGAGRFILNSGSNFASSADGLTWTTYQPTGLDWASELCFGAGQFIARRDSKLYRSTDAVTWTEITGVAANAIAFVKDRFIGFNPTTQLPLVSTDGLTWTSPATAPAVSIPVANIASNGDNFAAFVGYKLYRSTDALTWTQSGTDFTTTAYAPSLAFAAGRFLTGDGITSTDGVTWTTGGYALPAELAYDGHVHAANDRFFVFSKHTAFTSADGRTGQRLPDFTFHPRDIAYGSNRYILVGFDDTAARGRFATSTDGLTWTELSTSASIPALNYVAYGGGLFVAVGSLGDIYTSSDGLTWTPRPHTVDTVRLDRPAYGAGRWIIAGIPCLTSLDGLTWSRAETTPDATTIAFANETWIITAYTGSASNYALPGLSVLTSANGLNWTWRDTNRLSASLYAYGAGSWVGIGYNGSIIQSPSADFEKAPAFNGLGATLDPANPAHLTLSANVTGTASLTYQWYNQSSYGTNLSAPVAGATDTTLSLPNWPYYSGNIILLAATNAYGTSYQSYHLSTSTSQLNPAEWFGPITFSARLLTDGRLKLNGTSDYDYSLVSLGLGPVQFQWFKNGSAIPDANGPNITVPFDPAVDTTAVYSLKVTNLFGSVYYDRNLPPVLVGPPASTEARLGASASLLAQVTVPRDSGDVTFTWTKDGQTIRTATIGSNSGHLTIRDALQLSSLIPSDYGLYRVTVTNPFGTVRSSYFTVAAPAVSRLTNLSVRAHVGTGEDVLIAGYVGSGTTGGPNVLLRGIGPALGALGVAAPLPRAHLALNNSAGVSLLANDHWDATPGYDAAFLSDLFARIGAFPLSAGSFNAAIHRPGPLNLDQPPRFTAILSGAADATGVGMIEIYETVATTQRLTNLSARARVGTGEDVLIAGFVIAGDRPLKVLIRGVGPALAQQGIAAPLANPKITLYDAHGTAIHNNDQWSDARNLADLRAATTATGAFALADGSADAAMLETLDPGVYSVHVTSVTGTSGVALVEIYEAP